MKSIKEKAEEHLNSVYAGYDDVLKELVKESYDAGANYVLAEIEEFQKLFSTCMNARANGYLKSVIEQLKK